MKRTLLAAFAAFLLVFAVACASKDAPVTTAEAAIKSARQAWKSIYEKNSSDFYSDKGIARFEPYSATFENGVWHVRGTVPPGYQGDVLETTVRQSDGSVSVTVAPKK